MKPATRVFGFCALTTAFAAVPLAAARATEASMPFADKLVELAGLESLTTDARDAMVLAILVGSVVLGAAVQMKLGDKGMGTPLNALGIMAGIVGGLLLCGPRQRLLPQLDETVRFFFTLFVCGLSAGVTLLLSAVLKRFILGLLSTGIDMTSRPERPKPIQLEELPPRIAAALKKN